MTDYINMWLDVIEGMNNSNTYKLSWGRSLLELVYESDEIDLTISFNSISEKMLKYYWNQVFFFDLRQSPADHQLPVVVRRTKEAIEYYKKQSNSNIPVWYDRAEPVLKEDIGYYKKLINQISSAIKVDVCHRFLNVNKEVKPLYVLDREKRTVFFSKEQVLELKEFNFVLAQLLNYKWAQLLEQFNSSPRIASKVKGISDAKLRRNNLTKYKNILLQLYEDNPTDFYTGEYLDKNDISVDHVIPWSYMYSDDIWNLVLTKKEINSSKSNSVPSNETINKLKEQNQRLYEIIEDGKYKEDLKLAIDSNFVDKFYYQLKG